MAKRLKPFRIGPVQIGFPVVLAGMAGYTDLAYRLVCRRLGAPYCTTEMMLDRSLLSGRKLLARLAALSDEDHPVAGQIVSNDPDTAALATRLLDERGFDIIEINFGCPVRKALRRRRGGHMLNEPELALDIVRAMVEATARPVTVKTRHGVREAGDEGFWPIIEGSYQAGAAAVTVHVRTVAAKYAGGADWGFLAELKRHFPDRTLIGSGDMLTPAAALEAVDRTGVDAVSVARGALGNPWFFRQAGDLEAGREAFRPSLEEQRQIMLGHFDQACELYGPIRGPKNMRKFGIKYARMHPHPRQARDAFVDVKSAADWRRAVDAMYRQ
jgi:nifR3 family TIM-barrel protein